MTKPPFPHIIDSTILGNFRSCPQKMFRTYMQHWKPRGESIHLRAGKAFASGIEAARRAFYIEGLPSRDAEAIGLGALVREYGSEDPPEGSTKTWDRMAGALEFYFENYPLGADGSPPIRVGASHGIEFSFAEPLDIAHPETGDPILYTGRADMVAEAFGGVFTYDEKTASQLGASWLRQWEHRSQFTGYTWALRRQGFRVDGVVVRGVSILKNDYGTAQAITYRSGWEIDRWEQQTLRDIRRMIQCWEEGYWDYNLDHACTEYGGCALQRVCKSPDPQKWLEIDFVQRVWDPVAREERDAVPNV